MPPVLGPVSPSNARLWSPAVASGRAVLPSHRAKNETSSPSRQSSMRTSAPAAPKRPEKTSRTAACASANARGDRHALARRQAVGLDHDRRAMGLDMGKCGVEIAEAGTGCRRDGVAGADILGEALRALQPGGGPARPEGLDAGLRQVVDEAGNQRRLGADHDEVRCRACAEGRNGAMVGDVEADALGNSAIPALPGAQYERAKQRARRDRPGQRMLPPARTEKKDVHGLLLPVGPGIGKSREKRARALQWTGPRVFMVA
jgi:hypothetical protein